MAACPRCNAALTKENQRCGNCGYTLTGVRVYSPKHFVLLSVFLSALVPIYLAASNWGKVGKTRTKRLWLWLGFLGFVFLFSIMVALQDVGSVSGRLVGYAINIPIGYHLSHLQRPVYRAARRLGAKPASLFKGSMVGLGLVLCAALITLAGSVAKYQIDFHHGQELLEQRNFEEAAAVFGRLARQDSSDDSAVFYLAVCHAAMSRLDEAAQGFERYLSRNADDPRAYALLAKVRSAQGRDAEAESAESKARALDPDIFEKLFE